MIERVVFFVIAIPLIVSIVSMFHFQSKLDEDSEEVPDILRKLRLSIFFPKYLSENGRKYRRLYFYSLLAALLSSIAGTIFMINVGALKF